MCKIWENLNVYNIKKKVYLYSSQYVTIYLRKYYSITNKLILEV